MAAPLRDRVPLFIDVQTTGTQPDRSYLLEIGWAVGTSGLIAHRLIRPPDGITIPGRVRQMTGITTSDVEHGVAEADAWRELNAAVMDARPAFLVAHYARFELQFLTKLEKAYGESCLPPEIFCTQQIVRKLLPDLPSSTLRAAAGHFGTPLPEAHRAETHVLATMRLWRILLEKLAEKEIFTAAQLRDWLTTTKAKRSGRKTFLVEREQRLALPTSPGIYRMVAADGTVLYVGKSLSLKNRVNSYFRGKLAGKLSELMSQVNEVKFTETATPLEAALLESDTIKELSPPYNVSLRGVRRLWYFSRDLTRFAAEPSDEFPYGPFSTQHEFDSLHWLSNTLLTGADLDLSFPGLSDPAPLDAVRARYPAEPAGLLQLGLRFALRRKKIDRIEAETPWTPELIERQIQRKALSAAERLLQTRWLCRLRESALLWQMEECGPYRYLLVENGRVIERDTVGEVNLPAPPGWRKPLLDRQQAFDIVAYDRMRVLQSELRKVKGLQIRLSPTIQKNFNVSATPG